MVKVNNDLFPKGSGFGQRSDGYYLDGYLKSYLDYRITMVKKKNFDSFHIVAGREGFGKTTLTLQMAKYVDPTFSVDRIVFNAEQFLEAVESAEKYQAIVFDETMGFLGSRGAMSKLNRVLVKVLSEMRSKNLYVFMCIPSFFEMDTYPAIHRSNSMCYVRERGVFGHYDYDTKLDLYLQGKKTRRYFLPPQFIGKFTSFFPVNEKEYEVKKQAAIDEYALDQLKENKMKKQRDQLIDLIVEKNFLTRGEVAKLLGFSENHIDKIRREYNQSHP